MKRAIESFAVMMVFILIGLIVGLTVRYNMIDFEVATEVPDIVKFSSTNRVAKKENKTEDYLKSLEAYGNDKSVEIDPAQEKVDDTANTQKVIAEEARNDDIVNALNDIVDGADGKQKDSSEEEEDPAMEIEAIVEGAR